MAVVLLRARRRNQKLEFHSDRLLATRKLTGGPACHRNGYRYLPLTLLSGPASRAYTRPYYRRNPPQKRCAIPTRETRFPYGVAAHVPITEKTCVLLGKWVGWSSLTAVSCEAPSMASSQMWGPQSNPDRLDRRSDLDERTQPPSVPGRQASGLPTQVR